MAYYFQTVNFLPLSKGTIEFSFTGHSFNQASCSYAYSGMVQVLLNGSEIHEFYSRDESSGYHDDILSSSWIVSLNVGDSIRLKVKSDCIYTNPARYRSFTGKLIEIL